MITPDQLTDDQIHSHLDQSAAVDDSTRVTLCYVALGYHRDVAWMPALPDERARARRRICDRINAETAHGA
jgi:hypothetical protein